ncbi:GTPase HflX [Geotoga petraea]|uniref:GTPase HflX n=1 Tax=Geotoga petraea TaxID=28234 RepID=A0A1G6K7D5_9BACT|nr:GTPase HflX [Geotoga petraea]MDK2945801.1 GTPase [Geotoga sp.]SDC26857.1 GTP-binding protein HflX [Geotoga petraea]
MKKHYEDIEKDLNELKILCENIDIEVENIITQNKEKPDKTYYIGSGKISEIKDFTKAYDTDIVVFYNNISNSQKRNIEKEIKTEIIDRNEVILEIFRKNARTKDSKLKVELAQLQYELPKLIGKGKDMSNTGAGIGTLGPGETKLETDRRRIYDRINFLKKQIKEVDKNHETSSKKRENGDYPLISIVGYTSAGKSTFLKNISKDEKIYTSENLFSTLSPSLRKVSFPCGFTGIFSDTVGFIKNLPKNLFDSFKSTLKEVIKSDLIVHIVDISDEVYEKKIKAVNSILEEIEVKNIPLLLVFNKIDKISEEKLNEMKILYPNAFFISSIKENSTREFLLKLESNLDIIEDISIEKIKINFKDMWKLYEFSDKYGILEEKDEFNYSIKRLVAKNYILNSLKKKLEE